VNPDGFGELSDPIEKSIIAHVAVMFDIDDDSRSLGIVGQEDAVHKKLEALQSSFPTTNQTRRIIRSDLEDDVTILFRFLDFNNEIEVSEEGVEDFLGGLVHRSM
jgi:hypothetical protein